MQIRGINVPLTTGHLPIAINAVILYDYHSLSNETRSLRAQASHSRSAWRDQTTHTLDGMLLLENGSRPIYFQYYSMKTALMSFLRGLSSRFERLIRADDFNSQEVGVDIVAKSMLWARVRPDYEPLFSILDGLCLDSERRYWIKRKIMERNISDIHVYSGQIGTSVEIWLPMSHKTLTYAEENIQ